MQIIDRYGIKKKKREDKENRLSFDVFVRLLSSFFVTFSMTTFQTHLFVRVLCHFSFDSTS
jgi:hypothetical protein